MYEPHILFGPLGEFEIETQSSGDGIISSSSSSSSSGNSPIASDIDLGVSMEDLISISMNRLRDLIQAYSQGYFFSKNILSIHFLSFFGMGIIYYQKKSIGNYVQNDGGIVWR